MTDALVAPGRNSAVRNVDHEPSYTVPLSCIPQIDGRDMNLRGGINSVRGVRDYPIATYEKQQSIAKESCFHSGCASASDMLFADFASMLNLERDAEYAGSCISRLSKVSEN